MQIERDALPLADYSGSNYTSDYEVFASRDAVLYLGSTDELIKIQNTESLRGNYAVVPIDAPQICARWGAEYSIGSAASENQRKLAMLYLSYLSGVGTSAELPLEEEAFAAYVESNTSFLGFLLEPDENGTAYAQRMQIAP